MKLSQLTAAICVHLDSYTLDCKTVSKSVLETVRRLYKASKTAVEA